MQYESWREVRSQEFPEVTFRVHRMSFGRRAELAGRVRELTSRLEFHEAGRTPDDTLSAAILNTEVDRLYIEFGLAAVDGIEIDGGPATADSLFNRGPERLCREIVEAVKAECGLNAEERKN